MKIIPFLITCSIFPIVGFAEPAKTAPKDLDPLQMISGFHSLFDKATGFEYRLLEIDGSATVAMNPVCLYLVVTNNSPGDELQSMMVQLRQVSSIEAIRLTDQPGKIEIDAAIDRLDSDATKQKTIPVTLHLFAPIKAGKLPQEVDVTLEEKKSK